MPKHDRRIESIIHDALHLLTDVYAELGKIKDPSGEVIDVQRKLFKAADFFQEQMIEESKRQRETDK